VKLSLQSKWDLFNSLVIPADAPAYQRDLMKASFFAGASSVFSLEVELVQLDIAGNLNGDNAADVLMSLHKEAKDFAVDFKRKAEKIKNG